VERVSLKVKRPQISPTLGRTSLQKIRGQTGRFANILRPPAEAKLKVSLDLNLRGILRSA